MAGSRPRANERGLCRDERGVASATGGPARSGLSYEQAIERLRRALAFGTHPSLDGIRALAAALGDPHRSYRSIQVTGTNGKTSVTRMIGAMLQAHGLRTGVYTSPHLVSYAERIAIDGAPCTEAEFACALEAALAAADELTQHAADTLGVGVEDTEVAFTEFELLTAAALWLFRERAADWAVLEVGMGGKWDATSVVAPDVAVVTSVGLDHTEWLGPTREDIARDKAHVIKPGSSAVIGPGCGGVEHILLERALDVGAAVTRVGAGEHDVTWTVHATPAAPGDPTRFSVAGTLSEYRDLALRAPSYQVPNAATAIAAVELALGDLLDADTLRSALGALRFPGRFEVVRSAPALVLDGAHNEAAAQVLAGAIAESFGAERPVVVLGVLSDKDAAGIVAALAPVAARFVCTQPPSPRARPAASLAETVEAVTGEAPATFATVAEALGAITEEPAVVTGSLYTVGEVRRLLSP